MKMRGYVFGLVVVLGAFGPEWHERERPKEIEGLPELSSPVRWEGVTLWNGSIARPKMAIVAKSTALYASLLSPTLVQVKGYSTGEDTRFTVSPLVEGEFREVRVKPNGEIQIVK